MIGIDGASRMSSVFGLKASPQTATILPFSDPPKCVSIFFTSTRFWYSLTASTALRILKSYFFSDEKRTSAFTSFGKQLPPKPTPGKRNDEPMRRSAPTAWRTRSTSAPNRSHTLEISFMNEISNVCDLFGADVDRVRQAVGADRRIGSSFLFPGVGFGGSCFPKDVKALVRFSSEKKYDFKILKAVDAVNEYQKRVLVKKIETHFGGSLKGKIVAVWGLAFKPKT